MAVIDIPTVNITPGAHTYGPIALADTDTYAVFSIDRTVSRGSVQGFNGQPSTTSARFSIEQSSDGINWQEIIAGTIPGGIIGAPNDPGDTSIIGVPLWPGVNRSGRVTVNSTGAPVTIKGNLTTS